ncbi:MAG: ribosome silencing factor [Proteobacteria bacterium]|nr:ribosome silencing factor [Pseudomonadota bacterium]
MTSRTKSRSSAGKRPGAAKGGSKKPASPKRSKASSSGNKVSPRALAKASVKATPAPKPAPKPAAKAKPKAPESKWLKLILNSLSEMKAEDTVVIDLSDKSSIGDTMVVTTGRSNVHLASIADRVVKDLKAAGMTGIAVEGLRQGDWVVIDTGSVLVHVFRPEVRAFYAIEKMWSA